MSKHFKSLLTACLAVCMTVCLGIFAAACVGGEEDKFPSSVSIKVVLDDGTPVVHAGVGICAVEDDGNLGLCLMPVATDDNGVATINLDEENGKNYEVHLSNIPDGYIYVDENGVEYEAEKGVRIDVTKTPSYTITLAVEPVKPVEVSVKAGNNSITLNNVTDEVNLSFAEIENAGWYKLTSTNVFNLSGEGFELSDNYTVVIAYIDSDSEMVLTVAEDADLQFSLALTALSEDGTDTHPLLVSSNYGLILDLDANKTVYVENDPNANYGEGYTLQVSGTNFKANYDNVNYTETFIVDAPYYEGFGPTAQLYPSVFTVGTANGAAGVVTLGFVEKVVYGSENNPYVLEVGVELTVEYNGSDIWCEFQPTEAGTYTVTYSADAYISDGGYDDFESFGGDVAGSCEIVLDSYQYINLVIGSWDYNATGTYTITITKN